MREWENYSKYIHTNCYWSREEGDLCSCSGFGKTYPEGKKISSRINEMSLNLHFTTPFFLFNTLDHRAKKQRNLLLVIAMEAARLANTWTRQTLPSKRMQEKLRVWCDLHCSQIAICPIHPTTRSEMPQLELFLWNGIFRGLQITFYLPPNVSLGACWVFLPMWQVT